MFTGNVGRTNEVFALAIVSSTAVSQVSHMLVEILQKRENFDPSVLYHDTCPHNGGFWRMLFGANLEVRLGLFHLLHRIVDTLDNKCELYWKGLVSLKTAIYEYNAEDFAAVLTALKDGSFSRTSKGLSSQEIEDLRHSKRWKERCDPLLRKRILPGQTIGHAIERWIVEYSNKQDAEGRALFTKNTEKVAREQIKKVKWVEDPPNMNMYRKIPAGPRSTHQLPKWLSNRPESGLEKFHEFLAHLANTGSGKMFADALTLGGTADRNVKARWKEHINEKRLLGQDIIGTVEYAEEPQFWDHAYLHLLNARAISHGISPLFTYVVTPSEDNGEVFLSKYFENQGERNQTVGQDKTTKLCNCRPCQSYTPSQSSADRASPEEDLTINKESENEQEILPQATNASQEVDNVPDSVRPRLSPNLCPPALAQPAICARWLQMPVNCCFDWPPFYCTRKQEYYARKLYGRGRRGRPPNCDLNCPGVLGAPM